MANQVTDNRTDIADGTSATGWEDIAGSALAVDTDIRYGTFSGSIGGYATTTRDATLYNNGSTGLFSSGDTAYLLINCGVVSLLDTKANGGLTVRVTGATATDWAEFELFGAGAEWPVTFSGGWAQIVVDIDELLASPTNTNGTPPTVANIQRFGVTFVTATVMPRMTDNFWVGGFRILGSATPALIVEGRNGGSTDWDFASIVAVAAVEQSAVLLNGPGGSFVCRGPIQFGINDTSTHAFTDTGKTLLWDTQEVMLDGFYSISALGNSGGTTNFTLGVQSGTGDDATGAQGGVIQAAATAARFDLDFDDPNVDGVNLYGVSMTHGGNFEMDDAAVNAVSCIYTDVTFVRATGGRQVRCQVIDPNTADGVGFMELQDLDDIAYCSFEFSDGHAITLVTGGAATQPSTVNLFSGFGADDTNDAAIYNNRGSSVTINVSPGGDTPTVRTVANTTVNNTVDVIFNDAEIGSAIYLEATATVGSVTLGDVLVSDIVTANPYTYSHDFEGNLTFDFKVLKGDTPPTKKPVEGNGTISATGFEQNIVQADDGA